MNKDSKKQKVILSLIVVILIICIVIIAVLINILQKDNKDEESVLNDIESQGEDFLDSYGKTENNGIDKQSYFDILTCVRQYLNNINIKNDAYYTYDMEGNYVLAIDEEEIKQNIYDLLSKKYITENNVTIENLYEKIETIDTSTLFVPLEISRLQDNTNIKSYLIYGLLESQNDYHVINKVFLIVNIDIVNCIYSIEPISGEYNSIQEIKINQLESIIEANENNTFSTSYATNEESIKDYIDLYKRLALGNPEKAYELLDENYKIAKFGSLDNYKKYIENNREQIIGIRANKYQVTPKDGYTEYVCIDQNGKYYIFKETNIMDYTIILDTYTIDIPAFIEKYEKASDENKALMNIQRFIDAVNDKDYKYAYSKLDNTFKNNNFKTQSDFEKYMKDNFFKQNKLAIGSTQKQGDVYLCSTNISDSSEENSKVVTTNFVVQLKEGTDFVMSFSIQ